jgi:hypothetical protein
MDSFLSEARKRGEIFIGIDNRMDLSIDNIRSEEMVIQWGAGSYLKADGIYILRPTKQGMSQLLIFKKKKDGSKELLKTLELNIKRLPDPTHLFKNENKKPITGRSPYLYIGNPWKPRKDNC